MPRIVIPLARREHEALTELQARTGHAELGDTVRLALWHLAAHYDLDLPLDVFAPLRGRPRAAKRRRERPAAESA